MIISVDTEKAFYKTQHPCQLKTLTKLGIEENFLNHEKFITNILNGEKLSIFPLRSGTKQGCDFHHFYSTKILTQCHKASRRDNRHPNWEGRCRLVFLYR